MDSAVLIGLDWGTTSARAYLFAAGGERVAERSCPLGILNLGSRRHEQALRELCEPWVDHLARLPVVACGMIGSRQGWTEAPYLECPARLADIGGGLVRVDTGVADLAIIPGLACRSADGTPDVIRGEETQLAGLPAEGARCVILPGTHSKWALVDGDTVRVFRTFMTGEVFAVLRAHSILGRLATSRGSAAASSGGSDPSASLAFEGTARESEFRAGVERSLATGPEGGGLLHDLFTARTRALFGELPGSGVEDYLSGILIGSEIAAGLRWSEGVEGAVTLIGEPVLCQRYARALGIAGLTVAIAEEGTTARGLWRIAVAAGRVRGE